jgi:hypothetical protein
MVFRHGKLNFVKVKKLMVCMAITGLTGVKASTPLKCLETVANAIA